MFNRLMFLFSLVAVIVILAMINFTTPTSVGPLGVLVFFIMIYVVVFAIVNFLVSLFSKVSEKKGGQRKERYLAAMISFGPIMLLLVQSVGSLNIFTGVGVLFFVALGCFVIKKRV